jgi:hypothetical protein
MWRGRDRPPCHDAPGYPRRGVVIRYNVAPRIPKQIVAIPPPTSA